MPFALAKLALPQGALRRGTDRALNTLVEAWISVNGWVMALVHRIRWDVQGVEGIRRKGWYLVNSNHQSWVDILVLQKVFHRKVPFLKFFLKRQLIYVPVMGLAWWALDFPFMRRRTGSRAGRSGLPELRQRRSRAGGARGRARRRRSRGARARS